MFKLIIFLILISNAASAKLIYNEKNCSQPPVNELKLNKQDFKWGQSLDEMSKLFSEIYNSGKRLEHRAYKKNNQFILPVKNGQKVIISNGFIKNIINHIETALKRRYADYIFFSDMGHAHLFIDKQVYADDVATKDPLDKKAKYEIMLSNKKTKFLYHTAEQLKMIGKDKLPIKNKKIQWRYFSRNIVGGNDKNKNLEIIFNESDPYNTVRSKSYDLDGKYKYRGSGFDISASKNGCFTYTYNKKKFNFDISLYAVK